MTGQRVGIRIEGDASGLAAATTASADGLKKVEEQAKKAALSTSNLTISQGQLTAAMRQLPAQITDIVTGLASGQTPFTVLIQQGGQIKDSFGGIANAGKAMLGLLTPLNVALGAGALLIGGVALAAFQGAQQSAAMTRQLALMGDTTAYSVGQIRLMNSTLASDSKVSVGAVNELTAELLMVPALAGPAFESAGRAAIQLQRMTGQSAAEVAQTLAALSSNVVDGSAKLNQAFGFMRAAQFEQVQSLAAQGRSTEAVRMVLELLADTMQQRTGPAMGWLDRQIEEHNRLWGSLLETLRSIGRETSAEERLQALQQKLAQQPSSQDWYSNWVLRQRDQALGVGDAAEEQALRNLVNRDQLRAAERRAAQAEEQQKIEDMSAAHQAALANIARAGSAVLLAQATVGYAKMQAAADLAFQRSELTAKDYQARLLAIDKGRIDAQIENLNRLYQSEAARKPQSENEAINQAATLRQIEAQRIALQERRIKLLSDEARGLRDIAPPAGRPLLTDSLRAFASTDNANVDADLLARKTARENAAHDLVETNARLNVELIRNDRERAEAQLELEADALRKRLDLQALNVDDRKRVEEQFAKWRVNRERQITEQLKPEWRRLLDAWRDTNQLMQDSFDSTVLAGLRAGEDAWVQFALTGKLSARSIGDAIAAEAARASFRQFVSVGTSFLGNIFGSGFTIDTGGYGITPGDGSVPLPTRGGKAAGGPVTAGGTYVVGEKGPEVLRLGGNGGWVTPNAALQASGGGELRITLVNQSGTQLEASQSRRGNDGSVEVILTAVEDRLADRVANGQGSLDQAMRARYGLR